MTLAPDPMEQLKSRSYVMLLVLAAAVGVPISAIAYFYLYFVSYLQKLFFVQLPVDMGFKGEPIWWPLPLLVLSGLLVASSIKYLPGTSGHQPSNGLQVGGGAPTVLELPGVVLASVATLALGVVLGPEAPLIAIGGGLGVLAVRLAKRDAPPATAIVMAAAGSFAAISTLFGSPILGAFLLMEASGLAGPVMGLILVPGLLAAGIGFLIFEGLNSWTGLGAFSLAIPGLPTFSIPDVAEFGWALVIGIAAAFVGMTIYRLARFLQPRVARRILLLTPLVGAAVALVAMGFEGATGRGSSEVLFSGQSALPGLVQNAAGWTAGALVLLLLCKAVAYGLSLSSFRGGPVFPSLFIGAAGGMALSHVGGLPLVPAVAMGIGAMCVSMLKLPLTSVLLGSLLVGKDAAAVMPLVIVAVTVAYVVTARISPPAPAPAAATPAPAPAAPA